ncbi:MAG: hypothetical protein PHH26_03945 [Candidatus Thermoplasmatota archaeon]|nr:hypothetical protein [Candidatus Thermoplasmatota archaeon]
MYDLEEYLAEVERHLGAIAPEKRAEIIEEIRNHIIEKAQAHETAQKRRKKAADESPFDIATMESPEEIANGYLQTTSDEKIAINGAEFEAHEQISAPIPSKYLTHETDENKTQKILAIIGAVVLTIGFILPFGAVQVSLYAGSEHLEVTGQMYIWGAASSSEGTSFWWSEGTENVAWFVIAAITMITATIIGWASVFSIYSERPYYKRKEIFLASGICTLVTILFFWVAVNQANSSGSSVHYGMMGIDFNLYPHVGTFTTAASAVLFFIAMYMSGKGRSMPGQSP